MTPKSHTKFIGLIDIIGKLNLLISGFSLCFFGWLAYEVVHKNLDQFDENFLQLLHKIFPDQFFYVARGFYFLGEAEVAVFIVLITLGILCWKRYWLEAQVVAASSLGVLILIDKILKPFFYRSRPPEKLVQVDGRSFPSGHATGNLLLYFLLAYILSARFPKYKIHFYSSAIILTLLIGISSMYLRTHWLTDILGGYALALVLLTFSIGALKLSAPKYRKP
jgi:undecaprenyl-diphosphatase